MNKQPKAVTKPPNTAVTRVLFLRQKAIVTGETSSATPVDIAPNHPAIIKKQNNSFKKYLLEFLFLTIVNIGWTLFVIYGLISPGQII